MSLTASTDFTIADASLVVESATLTVLPVAGAGEGTGRLIHPTLGTYDYPKPPDQWVGFHDDIVIPPIWASALTLDGAANTLWAGSIEDIEVEEHWTAYGGLSMTLNQLRMYLSMWTTPPDPASSFITWYPSYVTALGYKIILLEVTAGGQRVTLDYVTRQGYVAGPVVLRHRIIARA